MRCNVLIRFVAAFALAIAANGCTTMIKGTTQRVAVVTDPIGAYCTLRNARAEAPVIVPTTPGDAELRRDSSVLEVHCTKEGHLEITERYSASTGERAKELQRRQSVFAGVLLRHINVNEGPHAAIDAADARWRTQVATRAEPDTSRSTEK